MQVSQFIDAVYQSRTEMSGVEPPPPPSSVATRPEKSTFFMKPKCCEKQICALDDQQSHASPPDETPTLVQSILATHQEKPAFKTSKTSKSSDSDESDDLVKFTQSKAMTAVNRSKKKKKKKKKKMSDEFECDDEHVGDEITQNLASLMNSTYDATDAEVESFTECRNLDRVHQQA